MRLLGTLVFMEAARGLVKPQQLNGKPSAMFSLSVLKQEARFNPLDFAKNQLPPSRPQSSKRLEETR